MTLILTFNPTESFRYTELRACGALPTPYARGVYPNICSCTHSNIPQTSLTKHMSKNKIIKTLNPSRGPSELVALCGFRSSSP